MLRERLVLGPILVIALVALIWLDEVAARHGWAPGAVLLGPLLLASILAGCELNRIFRLRGVDARALVTALACAAGLAASGLPPVLLGVQEGVPGVAIASTGAALVFVGALVFYARHQTADGVVAASGATLLAFVYPGILGGFMLHLRAEHSAWLLLAILLITKGYDIGAYFTGRSLGRTKLIPWLSPGKTWEGLIGGVILAAVVGAVALPLTLTGERVPPIWVCALLSGVMGLVGQAGDLVASLLKRDAGLKDYSQTLPGFGGVVDVIDSPLLVGPIAYWALWIAAT
ncbi:MAG: phosphatidate cytidylyltransferase [Planctomycetota bacterium]